MKKIILLFIVFVSGISVLLAQEEDHSRRERMFKEVQEFKMNYLAQEMDLNDSQKKQFFEVYEEMSKSKSECYKDAIELDRKLKSEKDATDDEYQQVTAAFTKANTEWADEEKEYNEKFSTFLTPKQIYKMKEAENNFRTKLEEMRSSRKKDHHKKKHDSKK